MEMRILVVDDDKSIALNLKDVLERYGHEVEVVFKGEDAIRKSAKGFDVILLDLLLPDVDGLYVLKTIRSASPKTVVIMITAYGTIPSAVEAVKKGASDYITKPFRVEELITTINKAVEEMRFETIEPEILSVISNETRIAIIKELIENGSLRFSELKKILGIRDPPKLSFHLRMLKEKGLISQEKDKSYKLTSLGVRISNLLKK